jgi:glycosyltransferase involved in cell wall biosynthesis
MSVGQYVDSYLPAVDGVIITVQNYARFMNELGCSCYVAAAEAEKGYTETDAFPVIRYSSMPLKQREPYRFGIPMLDPKFIAFQNRARPDIVHAHTPFSAGRAAMSFAIRRHIPLVATFHSKYYDDIFRATGSALLAEEVTRYIVSFYKKADAVWTVNEGAANTLRSYGYRGPITIMPNGTDFMLPKNAPAELEIIDKRFGIQKDEKVLLFVGQHILQKNLMFLLDAVSLCGRSGPRFRLIMVGDGCDRQKLEEKARDLDLSDTVLFAGPEKDREKLSAYYLRADLFVFPSVYDNAPLVIREAAAAGCPSVLVRGSNAAENTLDGVNAFLCENDTLSIAEVIKKALSDGSLSRRVGEEAKQTLVLPWRDVVGKVLGGYRDIIKEYKQIQNPRLQTSSGLLLGKTPRIKHSRELP